MNSIELEELNRNILVVDDDDGIVASIRKILEEPADDGHLTARESVLFEGKPANRPSLSFTVDAASQGEDAARMVRQRLDTGRPYSLIFLDMHMPPGWDGTRTIENIWKIDPHVEIVICSAHNDSDWHDLRQRTDNPAQLIIIHKPFESIEIMQLAMGLTEKWNLARQARRTEDDLQRIVSEQTTDLQQTNANLREANNRLEFEVVERKKAEKQAWHSAFHDGLTGLPNRTLLEERLTQCIARKKRNAAAHYAVVFLDVDNFKTINDTLGHKAGDAILSETATRLQATLRELDTTARPTDRTASRLGGDEFVILLEGLADQSHAERVAQRIQEAVAEPYRFEEHTIRVSVSQGVAPGDASYDTPGEILRDADLTLYDAKDVDGKGAYSMFQQDMRTRAATRTETISELCHAIERNELQLHYQPLVSLHDGRIIGVEALLRWHHPQRGLLMPADFLEVAEKTKLIRPIGTWVLGAACRQLRAWHDAANPDLWVAVNVSPQQLLVEDLVEQFRQAVDDAGVVPRQVILEITESSVIERQEGGLGRLLALREHGFRLHLDDFGTGYSSIRRLDELPIDGLKIDRSFTTRIGHPKGMANINAIHGLARNLDMKVTAEGIETVEQLEHIQTLDCDFGQGYLFSPPMEPSEAERFLSAPPQRIARLMQRHPQEQRRSA